MGVQAKAVAVGPKRYSAAQLAALAPHPKADAHKYSRGKLVLVAGSDRYPGAACLAGAAGQYAGAGYTAVYTNERAVDIVRSFRPSLVVGTFAALDFDALARTDARNPCAVVAGPGFDPKDADGANALSALLARAACPVLVDGGGLALLCDTQRIEAVRARAERGAKTLLTPHAGEAARLARALGVASGAPCDFACALSRATGALVVLKGPDTYISDGTRTVVVDEGTSALAKAGTGDVLAGVVGGLLCQGIAPFDAAVLGVTLHARAGALAARDASDISVTAEDVLGALGRAWRTFE